MENTKKKRKAEKDLTQIPEPDQEETPVFTRSYSNFGSIANSNLSAADSKKTQNLEPAIFNDSTAKISNDLKFKIKKVNKDKTADLRLLNAQIFGLQESFDLTVSNLEMSSVKPDIKQTQEHLTSIYAQANQLKKAPDYKDSTKGLDNLIKDIESCAKKHDLAIQDLTQKTEKEKTSTNEESESSTATSSIVLIPTN